MHNRIAIKEGNCYHIRDLETGQTVGYINEKLVSLVPTANGFFGTDEQGVGYVYDDTGCLIRREF